MELEDFEKRHRKALQRLYAERNGEDFQKFVEEELAKYNSLGLDK